MGCLCGRRARRCPGGVHLVAAEREEVAAEGFDVDGDLADSLNRVRMEKGTGGVGDLCDGGDWLQDPGFVIAEHDADELCVGLERCLDGLGRNEAIRSRRYDGEVDAALGQFFRSVEDGVVLDSGGDAVVACAKGAEEGEVIALGAAGGEDDFSCAAAEEGSEVLAGVVDSGAGVLAALVDRRRVAKGLEPEGTHGLHDLGEDGRGGVGVEVDARHAALIVGGRGKPDAEAGYAFVPPSTVRFVPVM